VLARCRWSQSPENCRDTRGTKHRAHEPVRGGDCAE
jgi:hypothetical protein